MSKGSDSKPGRCDQGCRVHSSLLTCLLDHNGAGFGVLECAELGSIGYESEVAVIKTCHRRSEHESLRGHCQGHQKLRQHQNTPPPVSRSASYNDGRNAEYKFYLPQEPIVDRLNQELSLRGCEQAVLFLGRRRVQHYIMHDM